MSVSKNPLINYFKKKDVIDNIEKINSIEVEIRSHSTEGTDPCLLDRLKVAD